MPFKVLLPFLLAVGVATPVVLWVRAGREPEWRAPLAAIKQLVPPVDRPGAIPRAVKEAEHLCNAQLLQLDRWSVRETEQLFEVLDRGLTAMKQASPGSDAYIWGEATASAPLHAMEARFHHGAPVDLEAAGAIHERFVTLMHHQSWSIRLTAASGAIHGYMENSPAIRKQLEAMTKDDEPLIAAVCRRFVQDQNSPEAVRLRSLRQANRGY
ncbi:MAG: hypothetical protein IT435_12095 [Phycisphaerales bacterium]|nr:hypothetical protein [Phycisphaerales bacterium]